MLPQWRFCQDARTLILKSLLSIRFTPWNIVQNIITIYNRQLISA